MSTTILTAPVRTFFGLRDSYRTRVTWESSADTAVIVHPLDTNIPIGHVRQDREY